MNELIGDPDEITLDPNTDYLAELVGPGKKFATVEEMAKGKWHSDRLIDVQNRRMDQIRSDFERERAQNLARAQLEEVMDRFTKAKLTEEHTLQNPEVQEKPIDLTQIESLVMSKYSEMEAQKQQTQNYNLVKNKLMEHYGDNYRQEVSKQITDLGLTGDELLELAKTKPQIVISALGLNQPKPQTQPFQAPIRSSQVPFSPTGGSKERTWSYYQELKAKDPVRYRSPEIQNQITEDYIRLGEAFEDGDFHKYS